jgi:hypothetical protein
MHVCFEVFASLCVCLKKSKNAFYTYCQSLMLVLHKLKLKELDLMASNIEISKLVDHLGCNFLVTSITLSLVVNS